MFFDDWYNLIMHLASFIPALGAIVLWVPKGRNWLIKPVVEMAKENRRMILKQEILLLIYTRPERVEAIEMAYEEYEKAGGNSYITRIVNEWRAGR